MGNALQAALGKEAVAKAAAERVAGRFDYIDDLQTGVEEWRDNILQQREELKNNTQQEYLKILNQAQQEFPSTKTGREEMLAYLADAKRRLDNNMRLVQGGVITMDDNTRFRDNLSQTFTIASQWMKDESNEFELTQARSVGGDYTVTNRSIAPGDPSKGGGGPTVKNEKKEITRPISGSLEAALQEIQSSIGAPGSYALGFDDSGLGVVTFYQQEIDEDTGLSRNKLDANGNPIPIPEGSMSILGLKKDANQRANRIYLYDEVGKLVGENTPLGKTYELMSRVGNMSGVITSDVSQMQSEEFNNLLNVAAQNITATPERIVSVLSENGMLTPDGQSADSIVVPFTKWDEATMANATVEYRYYDPVEKTYKTGTKPKYIKVGGPNAQNNGVQVPILTEADRLAADRHAKGALYLSLERDITGAGKRDDQFNNAKYYEDKKRNETNSVDLFELVTESYGGDDPQESFEALMARSDFKFNSTSSNSTTSDQGEEVTLSQTYEVDTGDGNFKTFTLTLFEENPDYDKTKHANLKKGDKGYVPQYVPISKKDYETKTYEIFRGKDDSLNVNEARKKYQSQNKNYNVNDNTFTEGDRNISVESQENVDIAAIPSISINTKIGDTSAIGYLRKTDAYDEITDNWTYNPSDSQMVNLRDAVRTTLEQLDAEQGGNNLENNDVKIEWSGNSLVLKIKGKEIMRTNMGTNDEEFADNVEKFLSTAITEGMPGREASKQRVTCVSGFKKINGVQTKQPC